MALLHRLTCAFRLTRYLGLRSPVRIRKGTFIDTYPGELITLPEADSREEVHLRDGISYLFGLDKMVQDEADKPAEGSGNEIVHLTLPDEPFFCVDGKDYGGVTRFMNHSCEPNTHIWAVSRERIDSRIYDLAMFASRDIPAYEELTFTYSGKRDSIDPNAQPPTESEKVRIEEARKKFICHCGSENCKGYFFAVKLLS